MVSRERIRTGITAALGCALFLLFGGAASAQDAGNYPNRPVMMIVPFWFRERTKQSAHQVISEAIAKGQTLDPAVMDKLTQAVGAKQQSTPRKTLGNGIVLLALGGAFAAGAYLRNGNDFGSGLWTPAVILLALGAAFTLLAIVDYMSQKKNGN